jgi:hypothetical protein
MTGMAAAIVALSSVSCKDEAVKQEVPEPDSKFAIPTGNNSLPIIVTSQYADQCEHHGIDGTYVYLPFDKPFEKYSIITNGFHNNQFKFYVAEEPQLITDPRDPNFKYYLHTTHLISLRHTDFCPRKFLLPGTRFCKIPTYEDSRKFFSDIK